MIKGGFASFLVLAVLAVVLGGCGSDSDTASLSKAEYLKQAEVVCNTYDSEREDVLTRELQALGSNPTPKEKEQLLLNVLEPYEKLAEELGELGLPEGQEKAAEEMVEALEDAARKAKANPESSFTSDLPFREANKQVTAIGLDNCTA